jgi:hypothetical protein
MQQGVYKMWNSTARLVEEQGDGFSFWSAVAERSGDAALAVLTRDISQSGVVAAALHIRAAVPP